MKPAQIMLLLGIVIMVAVVAGCNFINLPAESRGGITVKPNIDVSVEKVEVFHFHGANQCYSCKTVGQYAEDTINTYFADEVKKGRLTFAHINGELAENKELVLKYGATGSSLWIGVYDSKGFHKEQNINVWYKTNNKEEYLEYLKIVLEKRLQGDLS